MFQTTPPIHVPEGFKRKRPLRRKLEGYRDAMFDLAPKRCEVAVELGSEFGWWARRCMQQLPETMLYCVDPWPDPPQKGPNASWTRHRSGDDNFREWVLNVKPWLEERVWPIRMRSEDAAEGFDLPIDFLFIDGDHTIQGCLSDLQLWVPKVRPGGVIVGHDWDSKGHKERIQMAVKSYWEPGEYKVKKLYYSGAVHGECFYRVVP